MPVLRIQISDEAEALIEALSSAHKKPRAWVITQAVMAFDQGERLENAIRALTDKRQQRDDLALAIDRFAKAERELIETRERLEAEALAAGYATDDADDHQFEAAE